MRNAQESSPFEVTEANGIELSGVDRLIARSGRDSQSLKVCSDATFVRRAFLDVLGRVPSEKQARAFIDDQGRSKRQRLVDQLLENESFADYWSMRWCERLRVKSEFPINLWPNAAQAYHRWIHASIRERKPYDRFVYELLTSSGSNFRTAAVNFYRAVATRTPRGWAQVVALTFLGERAEKWPAEKWDKFAAFFSQIGVKGTQEWKEEIVYHDWTKPLPAVRALPDGSSPPIGEFADPREVVAQWLTTGAGKASLARAVCNRLWAWIMGRGIVHVADDLGNHNPPASPEVLEFLARNLQESKWDLRALIKLIMLSKAYNSSPIQATTKANFAQYQVRPIEAEVLVDAICQLTETGEKYVSMVPEPFTVVPDGTRAVMLPDGSISSSTLELFGRPSRDTGMESERSQLPSVDQRLYLLNSSHVHEKLERGNGLQKLTGNKSAENAVESIYLAILSRYPTRAEIDRTTEYVRSSESSRAAMVDLAWALINSPEFLYRH